ncbi:hypothetical protein BDW75DRAFT_204698 [Aspergillus navahoensis]
MKRVERRVLDLWKESSIILETPVLGRSDPGRLAWLGVGCSAQQGKPRLWICVSKHTSNPRADRIRLQVAVYYVLFLLSLWLRVTSASDTSS